jgi:thiosulfate/3-mercaptopyruvate sulfurtransferase
MTYETIIDFTAASEHYDDPDWVFVDCRFDIKDTERGEREYRQAHISGAVYAHLDRDLSGPVVKGRTGRHPLPAPEVFALTIGRLGIGPRTRVVAYDESTGASAAARFWWMLKWAGHDAVAVLDGGFKKWCAEGLSYSTGAETKVKRESGAAFKPEMARNAFEVGLLLSQPAWVVLDARAADRYRGDNETVDPVAGHITGALSAPYMSNLNPDGTFRTRGEIAAGLEKILAGRDAAHAVVYCGSGVTAAHLALAFAYAGKGLPILYPGSWSEWITDPSRPITRG